MFIKALVLWVIVSSTWRFQYLGQGYGPISFRELVGMVREGVVAEGDPVRASWMIDWQRAEDVVGLFRMARLSPEELERFYSPLLEADKGITLDPEERKEWWERFESARAIEADEVARDVAAASTNVGGTAGAPDDAVVTDAGDDAAADLEGDSAVGAESSGGAESGLAAAIETALEETTTESAPARRGAGAFVGRALTAISGFFQRYPGAVAQMYRVGCALVVTWFALSLLDGWSERERLRFPGREVRYRRPDRAVEPVVVKRKLPMIGECDPTEYLVAMAHVWLVCGVGTYFAAGWLTALTEER